MTFNSHHNFHINITDITSISLSFTSIVRWFYPFYPRTIVATSSIISESRWQHDNISNIVVLFHSISKPQRQCEKESANLIYCYHFKCALVLFVSKMWRQHLT